MNGLTHRIIRIKDFRFIQKVRDASVSHFQIFFNFLISDETQAKVFRSTAIFAIFAISEISAIEGCGNRPTINALVTYLSRYDSESGFLDGGFRLGLKPIEFLIFYGVANLEFIYSE